jgi:hypothetical protein
MKEIKLLAILFISITLLEGVTGCDKEKIGNAIANSGPCNCVGILYRYSVKIKRVNIDPLASHLLIERYGHPKNDSSVIYHYTIFNKDLPVNDTTLVAYEIPDYSHYFTWKVTGVNGDSLSSGRTPVLTANFVTFEVNY